MQIEEASAASINCIFACVYVNYKVKLEEAGDYKYYSEQYVNSLHVSNDKIESGLIVLEGRLRGV